MLLNGIRVLDFGWVWAGALPGQMLAFLGAEVIKIETRNRLDYMRLGPPIAGDKPDPEQQPMFHNVNRGKLSLTVDYRTPRGREILLDLVEKCDVVIENYSPGVLERAGLAYEDLAVRRPDIVMLSLSGGGQTGQLRNLRSYASTIAAFSGLDSLCGYPGEEFLGVQQSYPDPNASLHGAAAIVAALVRRQRTGLGDHIDLSQVEAGLATVGEAMAGLDLFDAVPKCTGNEAPSGELIYGAYECAGADNWVAVSVEDTQQCEKLAALLGEAATSEVADVEVALAQWCRQRSHVEAMEQLQAGGIAAGAVTTAEDRFSNPHYLERGVYVETEHPVIGWEVVYREPWRLLGGAVVEVGRAPLMGEANEYVIRELLGYSDTDYEQLLNDKILY